MQKTYVDYGHGSQDIRLWVYHNGDIRYSPVVVGNSTTHVMSGYFNDVDLFLSGRVVLEDKKITLGGMARYSTQEDIQTAINVLKMDYPDFKIIKFCD